jgi:Ca2+-binding EF-hand superfamily protein
MSTGCYAEKKRGHKRKLSEMDEMATPSSSAPFTRSATEPLKKACCFFCKDDGQPLFTVRTENAGKALQQAIETSQDQILMTRLKAMQSHQVMLMQLM